MTNAKNSNIVEEYFVDGMSTEDYKKSIEKIDDYSPNDETIQAIKECDTGKGSTRYDSYDDFLKELNT